MTGQTICAILVLYLMTLGKGPVRESRTLGSVRAKAEWLSYSTIFEFGLKGEFILQENRK